jgi:hypothetical protein
MLYVIIIIVAIALANVFQVIQPSFTAPSPRTHDTSQSIYHMNEIGELASKLDQVRRESFA